MEKHGVWKAWARGLRKRWVAVFAIAAILAVPVAAAAVFGPTVNAIKVGPTKDMRMSFEGARADLAEWMPIRSMSFAMVQPSAAGQPPTGELQVQDVTISRTMDAASVELQKVCCTGVFKEAKIQLCRSACDKTEPYLEYRMTNVYVSSYQVSGGSGDVPTETISFAYTEIEWTYTVNLEKGTGGVVCQGYHLNCTAKSG